MADPESWANAIIKVINYSNPFLPIPLWQVAAILGGAWFLMRMYRIKRSGQ